jgi:hypothetical protein
LEAILITSSAKSRKVGVRFSRRKKGQPRFAQIALAAWRSGHRIRLGNKRSKLETNFWEGKCYFVKWLMYLGTVHCLLFIVRNNGIGRNWLFAKKIRGRNIDPKVMTRLTCAKPGKPTWTCWSWRKWAAARASTSEGNFVYQFWRETPDKTWPGSNISWVMSIFAIFWAIKIQEIRPPMSG